MLVLLIIPLGDNLLLSSFVIFLQSRNLNRNESFLRKVGGENDRFRNYYCEGACGVFLGVCFAALGVNAFGDQNQDWEGY